MIHPFLPASADLYGSTAAREAGHVKRSPNLVILEIRRRRKYRYAITDGIQPCK
jgi:hypothetical protein